MALGVVVLACVEVDGVARAGQHRGGFSRLRGVRAPAVLGGRLGVGEREEVESHQLPAVESS